MGRCGVGKQAVIGIYERGGRVRSAMIASTNGIESYWALLKRGYVGVFHHFSWKHLHRYLAEFEIRWNMSRMKGAERLNSLLESAFDCRLTYEELTA